MEAATTETISRYQLVGELGRGGMAVVYKASDSTLGRNIAIKILLLGQQQTDRFRKRFIREAKLLAQLSHPNILKILDYGEHNGSPYLVTEYMPGGSLANQMGKAHSPSEAAGLLLPVAHALHYAHTQKIIHRDVKPQNILMNKAGQPMLADFGIAKMLDTDESQGLTGTGALIGTPSYMAPEQIKGRPVDARTDVYAMGVIFFELVTGRKPYIANTPVEVTLKHINEPIPKPRQIVRDLPHEAEQLIFKSLAKNPDDRYKDMLAFAEALEKIAGKKYAPPRPSLVRQEEDENTQAAAQKPKHPARMLALAGVGILAAAAIGFFVLANNSRGASQAAAALSTAEPTVTATMFREPTATQPASSPTSAPLPTNTPAQATPQPTEAPTSQAPTPTAVSAKAITADTAARIAELGRIEKISVIALDWAPSGSQVIVAGSKTLHLIDTETMKSTGQIDLGSELPKAISISSDGSQVFVLGTNIRIFDIRTRKLVNTIAISGGTNSMAVSSDDQFVAVGILNNKVQILRVSDGSVERTMRSNFGGWSVAISPDQSLVVGGSTTGILMWETETGTWKPTEGGQTDLMKTLAFSKDGKWLAGGSNTKIILWNVQSGKDFELQGDFGTITSLDFSPDGKMLAAGSDDFTVRLFQVEDHTLREARVLKSHTSPVYGVHFSPDGEHIISGANEGVVRLWGIP